METFAMATGAMDGLLFRLPPCAQFLYRWGLRLAKPGKLLEIDLRDFIEWSGANRAKAFCLKWVRHALAALEEHGFCDIRHRFNGNEFKVIFWRPENFCSILGSGTSQMGSQTSQQLPPNPHEPVPVLKSEAIRTADIPPAHPVSGGQERQATPEPIRQRLEAMNVPLNKQLGQVIRATPAPVVQDALAALEQALQRQPIRNRAGWLMEAVRNGWKPNNSKLLEFEGFRKDDLSDVLAMVSIELRRLGWTAEERIRLLQKRYGVSTQAEMSQADLQDWLGHLRLC